MHQSSEPVFGIMYNQYEIFICYSSSHFDLTLHKQKSLASGRFVRSVSVYVKRNCYIRMPKGELAFEYNRSLSKVRA